MFFSLSLISEFVTSIERQSRYGLFQNLKRLKKIFIISAFICFLIGCASESKREVQEALKPFVVKDKKESRTYGDTLKIMYEYRGDTVIQNIIDLNGITDDNFDSSFTAISIWSTKKT